MSMVLLYNYLYIFLFSSVIGSVVSIVVLDGHEYEARSVYRNSSVIT